MREVLRNSNFRRLWCSQMLLATGDGLMQMGLLELFRTHGFDVRVESAKLFFAVALPGLLLGFVTMAYLDRWQRRSVLMLSDGLRALLVVGIALWILPLLQGRVDSRNLLQVYVMVGVIGVIATFYLPARAALLPNLIPSESLVKANTVFAISLAVTTIGGRAIGGLVAVKVGVTAAVLANALLSVGSVALLWNIRMKPHATTDTKSPDARGAWGDFKAGLTYLYEHPTALPLVVLNGAFAFLLGILMVVFLGYAVETLGLRTDQVGYLVAAGGVGAAAGIGLLNWKMPFMKSDWVPVGQLALAAVALFWLSRTESGWVAAPGVFILGAVAASVLIYIDARLQAQVEDVRRGAVFGARGMLTSATMIVAFWLQFGTKLFKQTPPATVMLWLGGGTLLGAVLMVWGVRSRRA
jgi:hypothetical protein